MMTAKDIFTGKKSAGGKFSHQSVEARQKAKNPKKKRRLTGRELLVLVIPAVAAVLAVVIVLFATDKAITYTFSDSGHQYYGGASATVKQGANLQLTEAGDVIFADEDSQLQDKTTLPVYLDHSRTVVLTTDMLYYTPRQDTYQRAAVFSQVLCKENGMITVSRAGQSVDAQRGFLYDGKDFYLFLEPVKVSFMGYTVDLPAMSYAEVINGATVMLFDYENKSFTIETLDGSVIAEAANGDYSLSLLGDSMTDHNGEQSLLASRPELFDPMV